jgi:hypothetical protein
VSPSTITCVSCGHAWTAAGAFSVYERQAVEACPCPDCGAYTLCCHDPLAPPGAEPAPGRVPGRSVAA